MYFIGGICLIISWFIIAAVALVGIRFADSKKLKNSVCKDGYFTDYLSVEKTNSIKGLCTLLIIVSHSYTYLNLENTFLNNTWRILNYNVVGQGVVAMFMIYSGYAVMLSCSNKGHKYVKMMPKNRVLKVLFNFDIAVLLFLFVQLLLGNHFSIKEIVLALVGWNSLGNSNWYIFAIIFMYLFSYIAFIVAKNNKISVLTINLILIFGYIFVMHKYKDSYFYDTVLLYFIGMVLYLVKDRLELLFKEHKWTYYAALFLFTAMYLVAYLFRNYSVLIEMIKHCCFGLIFLFLTMKVSVNNKFLGFCGKNLFSIFILQRIPMLVLAHFGITEYPALFVAASILLTFLIAVPFTAVIGRLDKIVLKNKIIKKELTYGNER